MKSVLIPALFVFLWSTGFIGSKIVVQHAPPLTFLAMRMAMAALLLLPIILVLKPRWPDAKIEYFHSAVVGVLVHAVYLGGVFWAISLGTGAGLSSLIVGLQPLLTLCMSVVILKEVLSPLKLTGSLIGLLGFIIVVIERTGLAQLSITGLLLCTASLIGISAGTVYQKKTGNRIGLLPGVFMQYLGAMIVLAPAALLLEPFIVDWNTEFVLASLWLVLVLSIGAVVLLMQLIRNSEAGNVASLFYLVPPLTALEAFVLFDEQLSVLALGGMGLCVAGVAMVLHNSR